LDRSDPHALHGRDHMVVVLAVGAAKECRLFAGDLFNLVVSGGHVRGDFLARQAVEVRVIVGMAHDLVARVRQRLDGLRVFVDPRADNEKRRVHVVLFERVNELLRVLVAPRRCQSAPQKEENENEKKTDTRGAAVRSARSVSATKRAIDIGT